MPSMVKYGIIGCGAIAQRRHVPEGAANARSKIVAVMDPLAKRAKEVAAQYDAQPFTDHRQMLEQADLDAVVVCSPNKYHAPQTIDALRAGKHVLCEKPMATTRADGKKMIAEADKAKRFLMIGLNQRLMPAHVKAREILKSKSLGQVLTFRTAFQHPGPDGWSIDGAKSWFFDRDEAVMGATGDLGVHKADLMRYLLGEEFVRVGGFITTLDKKRGGKPLELDDNAHLTLRSQSGVVGTLAVSWTNYGSESNDTIVYCSKGVLAIGTDPTYGVIVYHRNGDRELHQVGEMASNVKQVASGVIDSFTESILKKRKPEIDGMEGYRCLDIILTAMEAAQQGKVLKIEH